MLRTNSTRSQLGFLLLLLAGALPARADTVIFTHGTRLECKVEGLGPEGWRVLLGNDDKANMTIDPATVERVIYDYDSRLDAITALEETAGERLYDKHYQLGVWCEENGVYDKRMYDRALNRYLYAKGQEGIPDDVLLRLGRMYEQCREPDEAQALKYYRDYLEIHPDSVEAAAAVERLKKTVESQIQKQEPETPASADEGMEVLPWRLERWGNKGTAVGIQEAGNNTRVLKLEFKSGNQDKVAFSHPYRGDLTNKRALVMDLYNPGKSPVKISAAIVTGANFEWYESKTQIAKPEAWTLGVRFDLTRSQWKSKATNWVHRAKPEPLNNIRNLVLLVYNNRSEGVLYVDALHFEDSE